jgi:hypothetical protein
MLGKKQRKDDTTMNQDNVIAFKKPEIEDPISDILREGARKLLATALEGAPRASPTARPTRQPRQSRREQNSS